MAGLVGAADGGGGLADDGAELVAEGVRGGKAEAIGGFIASGPQQLGKATPFMREYYPRTAAEFTPEERARYGTPEIRPCGTVWPAR